jgi:hypothetical protein
LVNPETVQVCAPVGAVVLFVTTQVDSSAPTSVDSEVTVYVKATPSATNETAIAPLAEYATVGVANAAPAAAPAIAAPPTTSIAVATPIIAALLTRFMGCRPEL